MSDLSDAEEFVYIITYPAAETTDASQRKALADGHGRKTPFTLPQTEFKLLIETRERIASVEQQMAANAESLERIEHNVSNVKEKVDTVDEQAMDEEYFKENYKDDINYNTRLAEFIVWGVAGVMAILGLITSLISTGVL